MATLIHDLDVWEYLDPGSLRKRALLQQKIKHAAEYEYGLSTQVECAEMESLRLSASGPVERVLALFLYAKTLGEHPSRLEAEHSHDVTELVEDEALRKDGVRILDHEGWEVNNTC